MKKWMVLLLCCLLLAGCAAKEPAPNHVLTLYTPNEDASGFTEISREIAALSGTGIFDALKDAGVLNADVAVNSLTVENGQVLVDVNEAFLTQLRTYGTAGEYLMVGSVINTLLTAYEAETVYITCAGKIMESGHVIYDYPLEFYAGY